jgi:alkylhydroperoxidase family enzyme
MSVAMEDLDYSASGIRIREDLQEAHRFIWEHLRSPGTWWTGGERVALAAESRNAVGCALCRERKASLSPNAVRGHHDALGQLPDNAVEAVHRIRTDPARLSRKWFEELIASGLSEEAYVELVGVVALLAGVDYFARAIGVARFPLPEPLAGEPSRRRPASAKPETAWVPMIAPEDANGPEVDLYGDVAVIPNIMRALSLVPEEARALQRSSNAHYVSVAQIVDPTVRKSLDRMQMELVASRVSALNECFY